MTAQRKIHIAVGAAWAGFRTAAQASGARANPFKRLRPMGGLP